MAIVGNNIRILKRKWKLFSWYKGLGLEFRVKGWRVKG